VWSWSPFIANETLRRSNAIERAADQKLKVRLFIQLLLRLRRTDVPFIVPAVAWGEWLRAMLGVVAACVARARVHVHHILLEVDGIHPFVYKVVKVVVLLALPCSLGSELDVSSLLIGLLLLLLLLGFLVGLTLR